MSDDLDDLMAELAAAQTAGRTPVDRHRDFRQLFLGSDVGKRVLYDILSWGHNWHSSILSDPHLTYAREGERRLTLKIIAAVHVEPKAQQTVQQRTKP